MTDHDWKHSSEHPANDPNCNNGTSVTVTIWHPTLEADGWTCTGYYHPKAGEWWSYGYCVFEGDDPFLRWRPLSDEPWDKPTDIDWEAVGLKWRAGEVFGLACEIFGDENKAYDWIQTPLKALDDQTPDSVLDTDPERVAELLRQMKKG